MVQLPVGVSGWTTFLFGLAIIAYRIHGIDNPRAWIEWLERRFVNVRLLQFLGALLLTVLLFIVTYGEPSQGVLGWLFISSCAAMFTVGVSLILAVNHLRHLVLATAEASDEHVRIVSIVITLIGLLWALLPWFIGTS